MRFAFKQKMIIQCCYVLDSSNGKTPCDKFIFSCAFWQLFYSLSIYSLYYIHSLDMMLCNFFSFKLSILLKFDLIFKNLLLIYKEPSSLEILKFCKSKHQSFGLFWKSSPNLFFAVLETIAKAPIVQGPYEWVH